MYMKFSLSIPLLRACQDMYILMRFLVYKNIQNSKHVPCYCDWCLKKFKTGAGSICVFVIPQLHISLPKNGQSEKVDCSDRLLRTGSSVEAARVETKVHKLMRKVQSKLIQTEYANETT